ncbi:hypothetical protein GCM10009828_064720 [Actinoplanes couchii]|uniref:Uncharacterized protein n=1 Tax=Actinoplanes couchii TaxID=403638 RepID=A0ABQ3X330_9ACTN|nr:hypothetical protein Aco03nite_013080 [Actinoplanes couchii]
MGSEDPVGSDNRADPEDPAGSANPAASDEATGTSGSSDGFADFSAFTMAQP